MPRQSLKIKHHFCWLILASLPLFHAQAMASSGSVEIPTTGLNEALIERQAVGVFNQINTFLADLKRPRDLQFANNCESYDFNRKAFGLSYDPLTNLISYQGLSKYQGAQAEEHRLTLLAHEYGHTIFRANLDLLNADVDDHFAESLQLRDLQRQILRPESLTKCSMPSAEETKTLTAFSKKLQDNYYFTFDALMLGAYDELFADIIAVMHTGRGNSVYEAIGGASVDWNAKYYVKLPPGYRGRDFTYVLKVADWSDNKRLMLFYDFMGSVSDMYNVIDPVRSYIWQNYLRDMHQQDYALFLTAYLKAVGVEYKRYKTETIWEQPVREMNERFIKQLDLEIANLKK